MFRWRRMEHIQGIYFRMDEKKIFAQNFMMIDIYPMKIDVVLLFEHNSITVMSR